jgi:uncharacterized protein YdhG (YjbR/CyaY superfamily)
VPPLVGASRKGFQRSDATRVMNRSAEVAAYLDRAPQEVRAQLEQIRAAVRKAAPECVEELSYGMPHYRFDGESGVKSRLCYFGFRKGARHVAFYTRPVFLEAYPAVTKPYLTAKSALQFPLGRPIPVRLIERIVKNAVRVHARASRRSVPG